MAFVTPSLATRSTATLRSTFTPQVSSYQRNAPMQTPAPMRRASIRMEGGPARSKVADTPKKIFMDRLKPLGSVRLIVRNEAGIMESIATFEGLFFATIRSGEYANVVDLSLNLDLHLLLDGVSGCRFEKGASRTASKSTTYILRILGNDKESVVLTVFLQWDKDPTDIEPERIEAWEQLKKDYVSGDGDTFFFDD